MNPFGAALRSLTFIVLGVIVAFGVYFFLYVQQQETAVSRHHLRLLLNAGNAASNALEQISTTFASAVQGTINSPDDGVSSVKTNINLRTSLIPGLDNITASRKDVELLGLVDTPSRGTRPDSAVFVIALDDTAPRPRLVLLAHYRSSGQADTASSQCDLQELIEPTLPTDFFEGIVLARSNGDVLFQTGDAPLRLIHLQIPQRESRGGGTSATAESLSASTVYDVPMNGEKYKVFVQPMRLPILIEHTSSRRPSGWKPEERWFLAGLLQESRFRTQSLAVSPTIVLAALALIALAVLALPLLKVHYLGAREVFTPSDVLGVAVSFVTGSGFVALVALFCLIHEREIAHNQEELSHLSRRIVTQLGQELAELDGTLARFSSQMPERHSKQRVGDLLNTSPFDTMATTPFFEQVVWIDSTGRQTGKWSIQHTVTAMVPLQDRRYFVDASAGRLWEAPRAGPFVQGRIVESIRSRTTGQETGVLVRRLDPDRLPKLARPADAASWPPDRMALIESRLRSTMDPAFPPGYEFAIVNRAGDVQFHSDPARNLRENLFRELGSDATIRRAVESRSEATTYTTYRTVPSVVEVRPIERTPWSVLVIEDARISRDWQIEVVILALGLFLAHILVLLTVSKVVASTDRLQARCGEPRPLWYWPDPRRPELYRSLLRAAGVLGVIEIAFVLLGNSASMAISCELCSAAALAAALVLLRRPYVPIPDQKPAVYATGDVAREYMTLAITLVLVLGVMPATAFYKAIHSEASMLLVEAQQLGFGRAVAERQHVERDMFDGVRLSEPARHGVEANVFQADTAQLGYYGLAHWVWSTETTTVPRARLARQPIMGTIQSLMTRLGVPTTWTQVQTIAGDKSFEWRASTPADTIYMTFHMTVSNGSLGVVDPGASDSTRFETLQVRSRLTPLWLVNLPASWFLAALGMLGLIAAVRLAMRKMFLTDFKDSRSIAGRALLGRNLPQDLPPGTRAILVGFELEPAARRGMQVIGPQEVRHKKPLEILDDLDQGPPGPGEPNPDRPLRVLLAQFDDGLKESDIVRRKLVLLEALNARPDVSCVLIESLMEPLQFLTSRFQDQYQQKERLGIVVERWAEALQGYIRLRPEHDAFQTHRPARESTAQDTLNAESAPSPFLATVVARLSAVVPLDQKFTPDDALESMLDLAQAHYRRLWASCSSEEKLVLYHLAMVGFVSAKATRTLHALMKRGLVVRNPNFMIMNETFRRFILGAERPAVIAKWQDRGGVSTWARIRGPIVAAVAMLGVFFFATQREALNQSLGLLATLAASAPGLVSLLGGMNHLRGPGGPKS